MPKQLQLSFVGGEISPEFFGRVDDARYQNAAATVRNFYVKPRGPVTRRPGTQFVNIGRPGPYPVRLFPFRYGAGQQMQIEYGYRSEYPGSPFYGYFRFHTDGMTLMYAEPWLASRTYQVGDRVTVGTGAARVLYKSVMPDNLNREPGGHTGWWRSCRLEGFLFYAGLVNVQADTITITGSAHGLYTGDPIQFRRNFGTLPEYYPSTRFAEGVTYYAEYVNANTIKVCLTPYGAAVNITDAGSGGSPFLGLWATNGPFAYKDLVSHQGVVYQCRAPGGASAWEVPTEPTWYPMPDTGEYEIPHNITATADQLWDITFSQQNDVLTFAVDSSVPSELRRYGALDWAWATITFAAELAAPTGGSVTPTYGHRIKIAQTFAQSDHMSFGAAASAGDNHFIGDGEIVYVNGLSSLADGYYIAQRRPGGAPDRELIVKLIDNNHWRALGDETPSAAYVRVTTLGSDDQQVYVVTAVDVFDHESQPSTEITATNNLYTNGASNLISWSPVTNAVRYRVYKKRSGLFGRIGETEALSFRDDRIAPDMGQTPPVLDTTLNSKTPAAVCHFEGRRGFGGTADAPQDLWFTRSNTEADLSYHLPVLDDDRIRQRIKGRMACAVRHLLPFGQLLVLTDNTEFRVSPINNDAITPSSFAARPQSYIGATKVQPEIVNNTVLFEAIGGHVRELGWSEPANGYVSNDLSERAAHLFDGGSIRQIAAQRSPYPITWFVTAAGTLLGLTYSPEQQLFAWHRHDTDGLVESVCVTTENGEDRVYLVVARTISGSTVRYIERMASMRPVASLSGAFHVDCGLTLTTSSAVTTISGLTHLAGKTVAVFANGRPQAARVVSAAGTITLATPLAAGTNVVHVGLPFRSQLKTAPVTMAMEAYGGGKTKNIGRVWLRVQDSSRFEVGPSDTNLTPAQEIPVGASYTGLVRVTVPGTWAEDGQILVDVQDPTPLTVVSEVLEVTLA